MSSQEIEAKPETRIVAANPGFMQVDTIERAMNIAEMIAKSSFCPKGMVGKPGDIVCALQMGQELGLKPLQALQNIAVINGRPSIWGDAMLAVCRQSPDFEYIKEEYLESSNTYICRVKRRNEPEFMQPFSEVDAKKAKLWGKEGPWTNYPRRMLQFRARGFCLRDAFPDLLRGILTHEEASDMPRERVDYSHGTGDTIDGKLIADVCIDKEQLKSLQDLIKESGADEMKILSFLKADSLENISVAQWADVCKMLKKKLYEKRKTESLAINQTASVVAEERTEAAKEFDKEYDGGI